MGINKFLFIAVFYLVLQNTCGHAVPGPSLEKDLEIAINDISDAAKSAFNTCGSFILEFLGGPSLIKGSWSNYTFLGEYNLPKFTFDTKNEVLSYNIEYPTVRAVWRSEILRIEYKSYYELHLDIANDSIKKVKSTTSRIESNYFVLSSRSISRFEQQTVVVENNQTASDKRRTISGSIPEIYQQSNLLKEIKCTSNAEKEQAKINLKQLVSGSLAFKIYFY